MRASEPLGRAGARAALAVAAAYVMAGALWALWAADAAVLWVVAVPALAGIAAAPRRVERAWRRSRATMLAMAFLTGGTFAAVVLRVRELAHR